MKKEAKNKSKKADNTESLHESSHGKGKFCSSCGAKKDTKKVGSKFLCKECRDD